MDPLSILDHIVYRYIRKSVSNIWDDLGTSDYKPVFKPQEHNLDNPKMSFNKFSRSDQSLK